MSKYSNFAKNLDAAFKTARDEYAAAYAKYEQAARAAMDAQHRAPDDTAISYELRKAKAEAARVEQKAAFDEVCKRVWPDFNRKRAELRADLEKAIAADSIVDPAALDNNAVYLMDSGTMTAADYAAFAEKYSGNHTMLKLIAAHANAAAATAEPQERAALNLVYNDCKDGNSTAMRAFDELSQVANRCSGQRYDGCKDSTAVIVEMGARWEELTANAIEEF